MSLVLASQSSARRALLHAAGVPHDAVAAGVDEHVVRAEPEAQSCDAAALALLLAERKALAVSAQRPGDLVLGCDQTLELDDGSRFDKAESLAELGDQLARLSGRTHWLHAALVMAQNGSTIWRHAEPARMTMRTLSPEFIDEYLAAEGEVLLGCVGGYRIEGRGVQLFARVEGSQCTIQGLPLLPLLDFLREKKVIGA